MEQNTQMTAEQGLSIINETLSRSRRSIIKRSGAHLTIWGCLLTVISLTIYLFWRHTGSAMWNLLWFAMPVVGLTLASTLERNSEKVPMNFVADQLKWIWVLFGAFSMILFIMSIFGLHINISLAIILMFGFAEANSGAALKNWLITIAGVITGVSGAIAAFILAESYSQMLIFTIAGAILILTGLFLKLSNK